MPTKYHMTRESEKDNLYTLEIPFLHQYDVLLAENYTVEIILPYGASDITVSVTAPIPSFSSLILFSFFSLSYHLR